MKRGEDYAWTVTRAAALLVVALVAAGCAASGDEDAALPTPADSPVHVHGLGIDPADGSLYIATHTGLWRSAPGERTARRVSESRQDTMGFTVVGPRRFLGSGHPDLRELDEGLPPHLGLIASEDAGRSWRSVSLLGEADFHVLRAAGSTVYGWDATNARLLASSDGGDTWRVRPVPAEPVDLALDPRAPERLVAATLDGLFVSADAGRTWSRLSSWVGLLAWPRSDLLFLMTAEGSVFVSADAGATWEHRGEVGGEPAALAGAGDGRLYAALHDGTIKSSPDGARWALRVRPY